MDNYDLQVDIAKQIFLKNDQERLIQKYQLEADEQYIFLAYLGVSCRIHRRNGKVEEYAEGQWRECREYSTVMTIYDLLCYHKGETAPVLSGQWCTVGTFIVTGITETEGFTRRYAKLFDDRLDKLKAACEKLGGTVQPPVAGADLTCCIPVTKFFSVLLQFWQGDEEFPPRLLILWDKNADKFLHFETTFYLQGDLLEFLKRCIE